LLDVWKQFTQQHPEIEADLILVGEGRYRKLANKMKPFNAYFLGPIRGQTLHELYASSHVFAFPSLTDTLGQVIMESQASGLGCLVSDVGGPQSLIINDQTGKILPNNYHQAWLDGLKSVLTDSNLQQRWSEQARVHMLGYDIHDSYRDFKQQHCNLGQRQPLETPIPN
ncbi:MAG: glycosyltransferase, partial [Pseudomonadota bacterium]|nr:glycosyltransferase [Pseudomonadota bacterium]